jgi:hypothetical protein
VEIGDLCQEEALEYLKLRDLDAKLAMSIYELVAGRMILLKNAANNLNRGLRLDCMYPYSLDDWIPTSLL